MHAATSAFTNGDRVNLLQGLLEACRKNGWTDMTPGISDRLDSLLIRLGFSKRTRREYRHEVVELLRQERATGKQVVFA